MFINRGATAGKAPKAWALPRFWVSIQTYKRQLAKKIWGRILGLAWLKFVVAPMLKWNSPLVTQRLPKISDAVVKQ